MEFLSFFHRGIDRIRIEKKDAVVLLLEALV